MAQPTTLALLDRLMSGEVLSESDIDGLLSPWVDEDLYLDYKHGNELSKAGAAGTIRQYVSAFANSAGGVLLVGIDEATRRVVGSVAPGGGDLAGWGARCLTPIAPYFSPPPRISTVNHRDGTVLLVAVSRNPMLVPLVEAGEPAYYLRIHDQTIRAPSYLLADLLLGRRQRPDLEVVNPAATVSISGKPADARLMTLSPEIRIENWGLTRANGVAAGILGWTLDDNNGPTGTRILSYLNPIEPPRQWEPRRIGHGRWPSEDWNGVSLPALCVLGLRERLDFRVPWTERDYKCRMALYVVAEQLPPTWYQLDCVIPHHSFVLPMRPPSQLVVSLERLVDTRPMVAWEGL